MWGPLFMTGREFILLAERIPEMTKNLWFRSQALSFSFSFIARAGARPFSRANLNHIIYAIREPLLYQ